MKDNRSGEQTIHVAEGLELTEDGLEAPLNDDFIDWEEVTSIDQAIPPSRKQTPAGGLAMRTSQSHFRAKREPRGRDESLNQDHLHDRREAELFTPVEIAADVSANDSLEIPDLETISDFLSKVDGLSLISRQDLSAITTKVMVENFEAGEQLIRKGEAGDSMHIIRKGTVTIPLTDSDGNVTAVATLGEKDLVGEMALLTGEDRTADVFAKTRVQTLSLNRKTLEPLLKRHPKLAQFLTEILGKRLEDGGGVKEVGKYRLIGKLGEGASSRVYHGVHPELNRFAAIKMLNHSLVYDESFCSRFLEEARTIAKLTHPNIVQVYDTEARFATFFILMELVSGKDLDEVLSERRLEPEEILPILLQMSDALSFAHSKGICHRDIKPANCAINEEGVVKLMDFGISKEIDKNNTGIIEGTPTYLAPEAWLGQEVDGRADIYALGVMAFEMAAGESPFAGESVAELYHAHTQEEPQDILRARPGLHEGLVRFIKGALVKDPDERLTDWPTIIGLLSKTDAGAPPQQIAHEGALTVARSLQASGHYHSAIAFYEDYLAQNPDSSAVRLTLQINQAKAAQLAGDDLAARLFYESASRLAPEVDASDNDLDLAMGNLMANDAGLAKKSPLRRFITWSVGLMVIVVLLAGGSSIHQLSNQAAGLHAQINADQKKFSEITAISQYDDAQVLFKEAESLWPAQGPIVHEMGHWIARAEAIVAERPYYEERLSKQKGIDETTSANSARTRRWETKILTKRIEDLSVLAAYIPKMKLRMTSAQTLERRSIGSQKKQWDNAIAAIEESPLYNGLRLKPQLGLVPLGANPKTGLWEFAHIESGSAGGWSDGAPTEPTPEMGIVMVLIPEGSFKMGSKRPTVAKKAKKKRRKKLRRRAARRRAKAAKKANALIENPDIDASLIEGPVHEVSLEAFFISKHEITQAQWLRFMDRNPSRDAVGSVIDETEIDGLHPVENMNHQEALEGLKRMGLTMPTEAQWEYVARAGTKTIYWTGDKVETLQWAANIADSHIYDKRGPGHFPTQMELFDGYFHHAPVGTFTANQFGVHDILGNVWEWCLDAYGSYKTSVEPKTGKRLVSEGSSFVFRGGGYKSSAKQARSATRAHAISLSHHSADLGLRACRPVVR